jgi:hypothetical protein
MGERKRMKQYASNDSMAGNFREVMPLTAGKSRVHVVVEFVVEKNSFSPKSSMEGYRLVGLLNFLKTKAG